MALAAMMRIETARVVKGSLRAWMRMVETRPRHAAIMPAAGDEPAEPLLNGQGYARAGSRSGQDGRAPPRAGRPFHPFPYTF